MSNKFNYLLLYVDKELQLKIVENFGLPKINIFLKESNNELSDCENFNHLDLIYNNYCYELLSSLPPTDAKLLEKMEPFSNLYFKTASRKNKNYSFITYEEILDSYYDHLKYWNWKINSAKITHLISYSIPHEGADLLIYALCKIKGIKTFSTYRLPIYPKIISKRYFVKDIFDHTNAKFKANYNYFKDENISHKNLDLSFKRLFLHFYPDQVSTETKVEKKRFFRIAPLNKRNFNEIFFLLIYSLREKGLKRTLEKIIKISPLLKIFFYRNPFLVSENIVNKFYKSKIITKIPEKPFIFLALHFEPELSCDLLGKFYNNQDLVVDMLASVGRKYNINIIVKKHPRIDERKFLRPKNLYQKMHSHQNVYFVSTDFSTDILIENSIASASITGSVCWESFLRGKPSILFGSIIFENAPGIFKVLTENDLEKAIQKIIQKNIKLSKKAILNYLKYLEKYTFDCTHNKLLHAFPFSINDSSNNFVHNLKRLLKE